MINLEVDDLQLYLGDDYVINDQIKVSQPTIRQIADFGEQQFFSTVYTITAIPSDMKSQLWDTMGLDWTQVDDFELFIILSRSLTPERTSLLLGDLDLSHFKIKRNPETEQLVLKDDDRKIIIDKMIYLRIVSYLRKAFHITPKIEKAMNEMTKKVLLDEDRNRIKFNKDKPYTSHLLPLISSLKVKQGYTKDYILNMGYVEFMDDIARLKIIDNADHLLSACYAGTIDMKKVKKDELNWMREIK